MPETKEEYERSRRDRYGQGVRIDAFFQQSPRDEEPTNQDWVKANA